MHALWFLQFHTEGGVFVHLFVCCVYEHADFFPPILQNPGMPPVDTVRDPRIGRLWTKYKETDLPVPKFKVSTCGCLICQRRLGYLD